MLPPDNKSSDSWPEARARAGIRDSPRDGSGRVRAVPRPPEAPSLPRRQRRNPPSGKGRPDSPDPRAWVPCPRPIQQPNSQRQNSRPQGRESLADPDQPDHLDTRVNTGRCRSRVHEPAKRQSPLGPGGTPHVPKAARGGARQVRPKPRRFPSLSSSPWPHRGLLARLASSLSSPLAFLAITSPLS